MLYVYFLNICGNIHLNLPGLFAQNPFPNVVNLQIWTIPFELKCYIALAGIAVVGIYRRGHYLFALLLVVQVALAIQGGGGVTPEDRTTVGGDVIVLSFFFGVFLYRYRERIPYDRFCAVLAAIALAACLCDVRTRVFCGFAAAYLTIYIGLLNPPRFKWILSGDYSYGLYLYGYPLQQAVATFPALRHWHYNFAIAYPAALLFAVGSWWLLERRALALRAHLLSFRAARRASVSLNAILLRELRS
jgi:peptidoglycan/LPS O-acetylase OafA/YrhL